ncbi:MAG: efflux RND transporter periplasmic adaptor subunit [Bradymonadaceae bacterium]
MMRRFGSMGLMLLLVAALLPACTNGEETAAAGPPGGGKRGGPPGGSEIVVETVVVTVGEFAVYGDYSGEFRSEGMSQLSSDVAGRVIALGVHLGDEVKRGQVLAEIDPIPFQQRVSEAQASVRMATASLEEAKVQVQNLKSDLARKKPLLERKMISEREIENLESQISSAEQRVAVAQATIEQNRARLNSAQQDLRNTKIMAPYDGKIAERFVDQGTYVSPNQPVFRIVDEGDIYLTVRVPERDAGRIVVGKPITMRVTAMGGIELPGEISRIAPALDPGTRTLRVDIVLADEHITIRPGMFARVRVELGHEESTLTVPNQALLTDRDGTAFVWLVKGDEAERTPVVTGLVGRERTQILEGLESTSILVLRGHERLRSGVKIRDIGGGAPSGSAKPNGDKRSDKKQGAE